MLEVRAYPAYPLSLRSDVIGLFLTWSLTERLEAEAEAQAEAQRRLFQAWFDDVDVYWPCWFIILSYL